MNLETIPNNRRNVTTRISLSYPFAQLCPFSDEPQPGSTITVSYMATALLLETKSFRLYLASFAGENPYGLRDLEDTVQFIAQECADILQVPVVVLANFILQVGQMHVEIKADPANSGAT